VVNEYETIKLPVGGISFFAVNFTYPEAPYFVYPKDPETVASLMDIWKYSHDVIYRTVWDDYTLWTYANWPNNEIRNLPAMAGWDQYSAEHSARFSATLVRMVTGPEAEFDQHWADWTRMYRDAGTPELERQAAEWMQAYYRDVVMPRQIREP
jgi:hypothetical protein